MKLEFKDVETFIKFISKVKKMDIMEYMEQVKEHATLDQVLKNMNKTSELHLVKPTEGK